MGLFDRVEGKLERAYNGIFARAFRAEVQPVEIASAIRRAMDDRAVSSSGRAIVPNVFTVELSPGDYDRLHPDLADVEMDLVAAAEEHCDGQRYQPAGPFDIIFEEHDDLETGVFRIRPSKASRPRATGTTGSERAVRRPSTPDAAGPPPVHVAPRAAVPPPAARPAPAPPAPAPPAARAPRAPVARDPAPERAAPAAATRHPAPPAAAPRRVNPADRPWLDVDGERYPLISAMTVLGRDESCDVLIEDPGVSRRHCEFRVTTDGPHIVCSVRDLGSTNGTFVNSERITSQRLTPGDRVTVGRTSFTYRLGRR